MLHPIIQNRELGKDVSSPVKVKEIVTLKFWFGDYVTEEVLNAFGDRLNEIANQYNFNISQIVWGGWESLDLKYAAKWWLNHKRRLSHSKFTPSPSSDRADPFSQYLEVTSQQDSSKRTDFLEQPHPVLVGSAGYHFRMLIASIWDSS